MIYKRVYYFKSWLKVCLHASCTSSSLFIYKLQYPSFIYVILVGNIRYFCGFIHNIICPRFFCCCKCSLRSCSFSKWRIVIVSSYRRCRDSSFCYFFIISIIRLFYIDSSVLVHSSYYRNMTICLVVSASCKESHSTDLWRSIRERLYSCIFTISSRSSGHSCPTTCIESAISSFFSYLFCNIRVSHEFCRL